MAALGLSQKAVHADDKSGPTEDNDGAFKYVAGCDLAPNPSPAASPGTVHSINQPMLSCCFQCWYRGNSCLHRLLSTLSVPRCVCASAMSLVFSRVCHLLVFTFTRKLVLPCAEPPLEEHLCQNTLWPEIRKLFGHGNNLQALDATGGLLASASESKTADLADIWLWHTQVRFQTCQQEFASVAA